MGPPGTPGTDVSIVLGGFLGGRDLWLHVLPLLYQGVELMVKILCMHMQRDILCFKNAYLIRQITTHQKTPNSLRTSIVWLNA